MKTFNSAEQIIDDFDSFFDYLTSEDTLLLELDVVVGECKGSPQLNIQFNNETLYSDRLIEGPHTITVEVYTKDLTTASIEISMLGKYPGDTLVENGKIVKDKFILIDNLKINNYNITSDPDLFYNKFEYKNNVTGESESVKSGFWNNSSLLINFDLPFSNWYQLNSTRNTALSESMKYLDSKGLVDQQYKKLIDQLKLLK